MSELKTLEQVEELLEETKKSLNESIRTKNKNEIIGKLGAYVALLTVLNKENECISLRQRCAQIISTGRWF